MVALATQTRNPLPFQDLEPRRFEDLVRQLSYDFKPWRTLEATGRAGSDDGFDARGLEIVPSFGEQVEPGDDQEDFVHTENPDRLWLIQCKREKVIGPKKLLSYLAEIHLSPEEKLHGIIFAAACDFSKKARDDFLNWALTQKISEVHIWGKGELEDMLFQPKNDNLLFAYFGISLTIRRRTQAGQLRADLAIKRKLKRTICLSSAEVLVRDPSAIDYPYVDNGKRPDLWWVFRPEELTHQGLSMSLKWSYAFIDPTTGAWDAADELSSSHLQHPWSLEETEERRALSASAGELWHSLPEENKAWLKLSGVIPLRNIIAVDDLGDDLFSGTHLYVIFLPKCGPFEGGMWERLTPVSRDADDLSIDNSKRIFKFPKGTRKPSIS